jgi:Domain of unknown function (DUF4129)
MKCKYLKLWLVAIFPVIVSLAASAQAQQEDSATSQVPKQPVISDSSSADTLLVRAIYDSVNDSITKWRRNPEFGYMVYLDSLLRKKTDLRIDTVSLDNAGGKSKPAHFVANSSSSGFLNSTGVQIFFWTMALFFVGFILYKLFFSGGLFAKETRRAPVDPVLKEPGVLDEAEGYTRLILEAETNNNFNLAFRYSYLQTLRKLADAGLIAFSPDKTNQDYIQELKSRDYQQEFSSVTHNYDYVWYGKFVIDRPQYWQLKQAIISFNNKL